MPVLVTSLGSTHHFSEVCETLVVNAHGCSLRSPAELNVGVLVQMHSKDGRETTAKIVYCQPLESDRPSWRVGAKLDQPENFWGLKPCPQDWNHLPLQVPRAMEKFAFRPVAKIVRTAGPQSSQLSPPLKGTLEKIQKQISTENLRGLMAELVQPLQAQVVELQEKLARGEAKRSRFEVSLSQIPPELEEQLEQRLKKFLGPRIQDEAREQSTRVLEAAKGAIEEKTAAAYNQFRLKVEQELRAVEQKTEGLTANVGSQLRDHLNRRQGEFHQQVEESAAEFKKLSGELLQVLKHNLDEEHESRRRELEQVQGLVVSDASRIREQVAELDRRVGRLDQSARDLESGLDKRLGQMASNTVSAARRQLESITEEIIGELEARSAQELGRDLEEAKSRLKVMQQEVETAASESFRIQVGEIRHAFQLGIEDLAQQALAQWRQTLAVGLNSLVQSLGESFRLEALPNSKEKPDSHEL
jgi:hypothetical protein